MSATSNLNVCQRCGTANAPVAKFCYQCGGVLRTNEQPVICQKCNTVNVSRAAYCKTCGVSLMNNTSGERAKICPRCNNIVAEECTLCGKCGYSFTSHLNRGVPYVAASTAGGATRQMMPLKEKTNYKSTAQEAQLSRTGAVISLIVLALFAAIFLLRLSFSYMYAGAVNIYGGTDILARIFSAGGIANMTAAEWILFPLWAISLVFIAIYAVVSLLRLFSGNLPRHYNYFAIIMTVFSVLGIVFLVLVQSSARMGANASGLFKGIWDYLYGLHTLGTLGVGAYAIPAFWLIATILSCIFRKQDARPKKIMNIRR